MDYTGFYEGDDVSYVGTAMPPAHGKLLSAASETAAYVKWVTGARAGQIDVYSLHDLQPTAQLAPHHAVRQVMASGGEAGVLNHLASTRALENWPAIATDVLRYTAELIRVDSSMETPHEQLDPAEFERVLALASRALLRDAFGQLEAS